MKKLLSLLVVLVLTLSLCVTVSAEEDIELEVWFSCYMTEADRERPQEEWTVSKVTREYEESHPGVKINLGFMADQQAAQNRLKAAVLAGEAPDLINTYCGYFVYSLKDVLVDVTDLIPAEDRENIAGWAGVEADGVTYGYPCNALESCPLLYNKEIVAAAGVDLEGENAPKNAAELYEAFAKIKDSGYNVFLVDDGGFNSLYVFAFSSWWSQISGVERITADSLAQAKFSDDEGFLKSLQFVADLYKDGFMNADYESSTDSGTRFLNGESAFLPTSTLGANVVETMGDNVGIFFLPNYDDTVAYPDYAIGGAGQVMCVVQGCKYPEAAVEYMHYLNSKDVTIRLLSNIGMPLRADITAEEMGYTAPAYMDYLTKSAQHNLNWNDNSMQGDVANEFYKLSTMATVGQITVEECAKELDQIAEDVAENAD